VIAPRDRDRDRRRRSQRPRLPRAALLLAAGALLFAAGVALGEALRDQPRPGSQTQVRTLRPATVGPSARTVTVTVQR
jgi:hypothetical protein